MNAQDKFEIDVILDKYEKRIGLGKDIAIKDFISLTEFAENQKASTPRAKEAKKLRSLIKQSIGISGIAMPGASSVRDNLLGADALDTFDRLIDDKDVNGNVRNVRDVYNEVIDQINNTKNEQNFLALNTKSREILDDFNFTGLSADAVKQRLNNLKQQIEEDTTNFSALEKAIEFETIKHFLKNYKLIQARS